jgi:hypothetical protein
MPWRKHEDRRRHRRLDRRPARGDRDVTQYVATVIDATTWAVIRSNDGVSGKEHLGTFPSAKSARAFIDSRTGNLRPTRSGQPIDLDAQGADASLAAVQTGPVDGSILPSASSPSGDALGRSRAGRSRREVGTTVERR